MRSMFIVVIALMASASGTAYAQSWQPPADSQRCPSKWGAGDQRGAANHMKPGTVLRAARLIRTGQVFELGRRLEASMPLQTTRTFEMHTKRTAPPQGSNRRGSNEEVVLAEIGQVGTQFDGFAHQTFGDSLYNCFKLDDIATRNGFTKLGVENVGALVTRGVLIDVAALKGVQMLPDTYEVTVADLQSALKRQQLTLEPGDAIILHTGWGLLWGKDNGRYMKANPGISTAAAEWLVKQDPILVGADTAPINVTPNPDPQISNPVHQIMLVFYGIHLLENLRLDELAAARAYEFALIVQPLKLVGGTGSTVAPVALR
ncbi:MAG: cyclase family protein [Vicinamibacterales bacterium]